MDNFLDFLAKGMSLIGAFDPKIILILFILFWIGESSGLSVPYLIETTWLLAGYQVVHDQLVFPKLLLLLFAAQLGRQFGAGTLYVVVRRGESIFAARFPKRFKKLTDRFKIQTDMTSSTPFASLWHRLNFSSPFPVALGMLLWLRLPLAFYLSAKGKLRVFLSATSLSGIVYDGTYIGIGAILGTTTTLKPIQMIPYFIVVMTAIYILTFVIRKILNNFSSRRKREAVQHTADGSM